MNGMPYGLGAMLKEGHKHFSGVDEAVMRNIEAAKGMAHITRTSLGPNGGGAVCLAASLLQFVAACMRARACVRMLACKRTRSCTHACTHVRMLLGRPLCAAWPCAQHSTRECARFGMQACMHARTHARMHARDPGGALAGAPHHTTPPPPATQPHSHAPHA